MLDWVIKMSGMNNTYREMSNEKQKNIQTG